MQQGRYTEAEPLLLGSIEVLQQTPGVPRERVQQALERIIALYDAWEQPEKAKPWRLRRLDLDFPTDPFVR